MAAINIRTFQSLTWILIFLNMTVIRGIKVMTPVPGQDETTVSLLDTALH